MRKIAPALILIALFSIGLYAQTIGVRGFIEKGTVKKGASAQGLIVLTIPAELHTNSSKPSNEFLLPTIIKLSSEQIKDFRVFYPKGKDKKFDFSESKLNVYEGKTIIPFSFNAPKTFKGKTIRIKAKVTYQACSNEVCYPPQKKEIYLMAKVF